MLLCEVVTALLFVCLSNARDFYSVPEPKIEVFNHGRLRISIEDSVGITFVAFHVNINEDIHNQQVGEFSKELYRTLHGRWSFEVPSARLQIGDKVHYWLFVIKDHMGYRKLGIYTLKKLENGSLEASDPHPTQPTPNQSQQQPEICKTCTDGKPQVPTTSSSPENNQGPHLSVCEHFLLNITQNLLDLQSQLENMRKANQRLTDYLEKYPDAKTLTLTASKILPDNDPVMTVRFIIREKLNLNPDFVSAVRISDDSIAFKVATVAEKLEILAVAKELLLDSKFAIS